MISADHKEYETMPSMQIVLKGLAGDMEYNVCLEIHYLFLFI